MLDDLSNGAVRLLLSLLYQEPVKIGRRQHFKALKELERACVVRLTRRPPKPALIQILHWPPCDRPISDSDLNRLDKQEEINPMIYSNLSNRSIDLEPAEHDEPQPVTPGLTPLQGPLGILSTGSAKDTVTVSSEDTVSAKDTVTGSAKDTMPPEDTVTVSAEDTVEAADRMPVDTSEGYGVKSSFWRRRAAQIDALEEAWGEFWPNVPLTADMVRKYLRLTGDRAMPVYEMFVRARKAKKPIEYPATYIEKALEREKQAKPPAEHFRRDYEEPFDGELEEETEEERAARIARAKRLAYLFEPKGVDGE